MKRRYGVKYGYPVFVDGQPTYIYSNKKDLVQALNSVVTDLKPDQVVTITIKARFS